MEGLWNWISKFMSGISAFWQWLLTPIEVLGNWQPISIVGVTGLAVILGFWIFKLVNPLS